MIVVASRCGAVASVLLIVAACDRSSPSGPTNVTSGSGQRAVYVATTGSDGNQGTLSAPWLTLGYAISRLRAGDTLYIRGGTYTGAANTIDTTLSAISSGTASAPITISAYPGGLADSAAPGPRPGAEVVTIQPPGPATFAISLTLPAGTAPSYLTFEDLIIDGVNNPYSDQAGGGGVSLIYTSGGASHNQFIHLEVKNNGGTGLGFSLNNGNADSNQVLYCLLHDNGTDVKYANAGYGIYNGTNSNLFQGNSLYNNHGYGMQLRGSNNIVRNNQFYNNVVHGGGGVGGSSGGGFNMMADSLGMGDNNQFYDNLVYNNGTGGPAGSNAAGILIYSYESHAKVHDNTVYGNNGFGIQLQYYDGTAPPIVANNTVYNNSAAAIVDLGDVQNGAKVAFLSNNGVTGPGAVNPAAVGSMGVARSALKLTGRQAPSMLVPSRRPAPIQPATIRTSPEPALPASAGGGGRSGSARVPR